MKWVWASALIALAACAEEVPGVEPPVEEVYFPIGAVATTLTDPPVLIVVSSNFDQRYNAGHLSTYRLQGLVDLANDGRAAGALNFVDALEGSGAWVSRVRIRQLAGEALLVPSADGTSHRIFTASRGRNLVTMVAMDDSGNLGCAADGADLVPALDCTPSAEYRTIADDPFPMAWSPLGRDPDDSSALVAGRGTVAVGHLTPRVDGARLLSTVAALDVDDFETRVTTTPTLVPEPAIPTAEGEPNRRLTMPGVGGVSGVIWVGDDTGGAFISASRLFSTNGALVVRSLELSTTAATDLVVRDTLVLHQEVSAQQTRGICKFADDDRIVISTRFDEAGIDAFNGGITIVDTSTLTDLRVAAVYEVGEELARPTCHERANGQKLVYLPDIRLNRIFIVDVTTNRPSLVGSISGYATRTLEGEPTQVGILSSPAEVTIAELNGETWGFVTNFSNSTLAVLDLRGDDPRDHQVIARLGRNIDAEGDAEAPD